MIDLRQRRNVSRRLLGGLLAIGCGTSSDLQVTTVPELERIPLHVTNHHYLDISIYALCDGQRTRIGTAVGNSSTRLDISWRLVGQGRDMQLVADAIGSDEQTVTPTIIIQPGQFIELLLESRLARSSVGVY